MKAGPESIAQLRWRAKKSARALCGLGGPAATHLLPRSPLRVLTYHRICKYPRDPFSIAPLEFETMMEHIAYRDLAVGVDAIDDALSPTPSDETKVLVTIDDIETNVYENAYPILNRMKIPAILFPVVGMVGKPGFVTWDQLREMAEGGMTIGSHTMTHRQLAQLSPEEARTELEDSRKRLSDELGVPIETLAYPFGTRAAIAPWLGPLVEQAGYRYAFTSIHGGLRTGAEPAFLPRVKVEAGDSPRHFRRLVAGAMDLWRVVDEGLVFLQRPAEGREGQSADARS